jgi:tetratricopeptide (TPR) repeat protein
MIIDNADDTEMFFSPIQATSPESEGASQLAQKGNMARFIPECSHGSILVTTRNKQTGARLTRGRAIIEVGQMDQKESSRLFQMRLEDTELDPDQISLLSSRLENLPLALVQATAFIQENSLTIAKYLKLLEESENRLVKVLSEPFEAIGRDSGVPNAVTATWIVSFEQIRRQYCKASDLLSLISFFDRQGIPKAFLSHYSEQELGHEGSQRKQVDEENEPLELEKALGILKAFSFVLEGQVDESLSVHRLIQLVVRKWLIENGTSREFATKALLAVSALYPFGSHENRQMCGDYLPHAYAVLSYDGSSSTTETIARSSLLHCVAGFLVSQGQWKKAEELQIQAVEGRKMVLGLEHPDTLNSINNLASTYWNQGRWKEAEELEVQVTETRKRVLGLEHPNTLTSINNLALTYQNQGRWKEAEELEVQVMETRKGVLGLEHPNTLNSINNLALTYQNQGRWTEAEELEVQVTKTRKRVLGLEHPNTLTSIANLASTYQNQGRWKEAEELGVQVTETRKRVLGLEHPDTLTSMNNLAWTLKSQGRDNEAFEIISTCMELSINKLGSNHPDTMARSRAHDSWKKQ